MPCRATQDVWVFLESSDKMWSTGKGNGKPLQYSCLENPMNSMKRQRDRTPKDELPRSVGTQYASGDQWRNNSRKNEVSNAPGKSLQSCLTLCDPIDGSPSGSVPGTVQARILEWVAISFSSACMHAKSLQSCPTLCDPMDSSPPGSSVHGIL